MSSDAGHGLEDFVPRLLLAHGAEIEHEGARLKVLLPEELAHDLGIPEYCTLDLAAQGEGDYSIQYGQPLLEKLADIACRQIPFACLRLRFDYIKSQGFDRLISEQFTLPNAVGRVESSAETLTDYLLLTCRFLLQSDEQKEDLLTMGFNLESGAPVDAIAGLLDGVEKEAASAAGAILIDPDRWGRVLGWVRRRAPEALEPHIASFRDSMNRRYRRDVANLEEYYVGLKREMEVTLRRPGLSEDQNRDRSIKIGLIPDELAAKTQDLFKKYSIKADLRLCAAMLIRTPAVKVLYRAAVGREGKQLALFYNPITKSLDPVLCAGCGSGTYHVRFCRNLHPLCPRCGQACPVCA